MGRKPKGDNGEVPPALTQEQRAAAKRERFVRLAPKRVNAAVKRIGHVAKLGNRQSYAYSDDDAGKILAALVDAVDEAERAFAGSNKVKAGFSL